MNDPCFGKDFTSLPHLLSNDIQRYHFGSKAPRVNINVIVLASSLNTLVAVSDSTEANPNSSLEKLCNNPSSAPRCLVCGFLAFPPHFFDFIATGGFRVVPALLGRGFILGSLPPSTTS
jgi:hypothetical protein